MQARHLHGGGGEIHLTATADISPGTVFLAAGIAAVVAGSQPIKSGERYTALTKGVFAIATASATTFTGGDEIEWDDTNDLCVAATAGDFNLGRATEDKASGEVVTKVNLNEVTP